MVTIARRADRGYRTLGQRFGAPQGGMVTRVRFSPDAHHSALPFRQTGEK